MPPLEADLLGRLPPPERRREPRGYARVFTGAGCVQECASCPFSHTEERAFRPADEVRRAVAEARRRGARGVIFGGGEPAAHPAIRDLIVHARQQGLGAAMATNAVRLADAALRREVVGAGLGRVHAHLFSADADEHERLGGDEADLEASLGALAALRDDGVTVVAAIPLLAETLAGQAALREMLVARQLRRAHLFVPQHVHPPSTAATLTDAAAAARAWRADDRLEVTVTGLPLCLLPDHLAAFVTVPHRDPRPRPPASPAAVAWTCRECAGLSRCGDAPPAAAPREALAPLSPFLEEISNSLNYSPTRRVADATSLDACPIRAGDAAAPALAPDREILLFAPSGAGGRLVVAATDSADFQGARRRRVLDEVGQVYLDVSDKLLLDDFASDLVPLRPADECATCPQRGPCPGAWAAATLDTGFPESERAVLDILGRFEGRVLDVGVGEPHSLKPLLIYENPAVGPDHLPFDYLGIEPAEGRVRHLRDSIHWLPVIQAAAEDDDLAERTDAAARPFDHLLFLRSWNHLHDPRRALRNAISVLRPGGTLLIVENTAFALVRSRRKIRAVRQLEAQGGAPFEHYRNHTSHEALEVLEPFGLEVLAHHPVTPATANQWILHVRAPA